MDERLTDAQLGRLADLDGDGDAGAMREMARELLCWRLNPHGWAISRDFDASGLTVKWSDAQPAPEVDAELLANRAALGEMLAKDDESQIVIATLQAKIARRAADAQPAPDVDAVLMRDSRDIETATGRACPSCGFAHVTEGASKSHDWYCDHCQGYGNWDTREECTPAATADGAARAEIVEFVRSYRAKNGVGPSYQDILDGTSQASKGAVYAFVQVLLRNDVLDCHRLSNGEMVARSLEVYGE